MLGGEQWEDGSCPVGVLQHREEREGGIFRLHCWLETWRLRRILEGQKRYCKCHVNMYDMHALHSAAWLGCWQRSFLFFHRRTWWMVSGFISVEVSSELSWHCQRSENTAGDWLVSRIVTDILHTNRRLQPEFYLFTRPIFQKKAAFKATLLSPDKVQMFTQQSCC